MDIVLITRDRAELTLQTILSMKENAADWSKHNLVVIFDGTPIEHSLFLGSAAGMKIRDEGVRMFRTGKQIGVGAAKNTGAQVIARERGLPYPPLDRPVEQINERTLLMFSDNDMYYLPNWDRRLELAMATNNFVQVGGWRHPYHHARSVHHWISNDGGDYFSALSVDAVTGNCFVIRWGDWLLYGPFADNAIGPGQSEDTAFSSKIRAAGGQVVALDPPVAIHCGLVNSEGLPAVGYDPMRALAHKQIAANKLEGKVKVLYGREGGEGACVPAGGATTDDVRGVRREDVSRVAGATEAGLLPVRLNLGSGQRRFDPKHGWINVDVCSRPPDQVPDLVLDARRLGEHFPSGSVDTIVLHHMLEHFGCGEANDILRACWTALRSGGSILIFVPNMRALAGRWLGGEIDTFTFMVNAYGAYQGEDGDRHKWGFDSATIYRAIGDAMNTVGPIPYIKVFDWREIPGADFARDWWVLAVEVVKPV